MTAEERAEARRRSELATIREVVLPEPRRALTGPPGSYALSSLDLGLWWWRRWYNGQRKEESTCRS